MSEMPRTEEERWTKDILSKTSPRLALKHYFEVVNRIGWLDFELKRKIFTRLELKNSIEKWLGDLEPGHPYRTLKARSVQVMDEVVDQLSSCRLLMEEDGFLKKSDDFGRFLSLLRWVRSSVERRICWVIFHFHAKSVGSFTTNEILDFLSYPRPECIEELPELTTWKPVEEPSATYRVKGRWVKVLDRKGDGWAIIGKPFSSRKPLLLMDLRDKLESIVSMFAETRNSCTSDEILSLLECLERQAVERALGRIHVKSVENHWIVDANLIHKPYGILDKLKLAKAFQVKLVIRNPKWLRFVRVESRDIVDGDPIKYFQLVLDEVFNLDRSSKNIKDFQKDCYKILLRWNQKLYPFGIELKLRRASPFGYQYDSKRFAIRISRHHREELRGSLMDRYSIIQVCRMPESRETSMLSILSNYKGPDELLNYLSEKRRGYDLKLRNSYEKILLFSNWWRKDLEEMVRLNPDYDRLFLYSAGFGEIVNSLIAAFLSANNGFFRSSFKDLRDTIEWLEAAKAFVQRTVIEEEKPFCSVEKEPRHKGPGDHECFSCNANKILALTSCYPSGIAKEIIMDKFLPLIPKKFVKRKVDENPWNANVAMALGKSYQLTQEEKILLSYFTIMDELKKRDIQKSSALPRSEEFKVRESWVTFFYAYAYVSSIDNLESCLSLEDKNIEHR